MHSIIHYRSGSITISVKLLILQTQTNQIVEDYKSTKSKKFYRQNLSL